MTSTRVKIVFDEGAGQMVERLQKASAAPGVGEVIADAIGFYDWARAQVEAGRVISVVDGGVVIKEAVLPFKPKAEAATELKSRNCYWCGGRTFVDYAYSEGADHRVVACANFACGALGPYQDTEEEAIRVYNALPEKVK